MCYRTALIVLLVCLGTSACGGGGGGMDSAGSIRTEFSGSLAGLDLAGTPRAQPLPTMGALEAFD